MVKCLKMYVWIQSGTAGPVRQIWVSGPVWSGNSYAQWGQALFHTLAKVKKVCNDKYRCAKTADQVNCSKNLAILQVKAMRSKKSTPQLKN